ncbi:MAG TPA: ATP-binding cassette domain-containing protein [Spirochaetota bacterium]|nr:ATP-binding cassette domain-containing protein [Spirochaetota bacterium]HOL57017.1 ATP-binding cassette domain-containing protein [Spirochaetota bacterium]HPP04596.1 ATP-binding cassette domain-containing protein [Spirochaetota bacterium]
MTEILRFENVNLFLENNHILKDINFQMKKGENWAIIGRNGSGKSFLLRIISTYQYPSNGKVFIMGNKLGETNVWNLRKKIGIVSDDLQKEYKETTTVSNVILSGFFSSIGIYEEPDLEMIKKKDQILDFLDLNHIKDKPFGKISYGEQKRTLIGRALVFDPDLLILDEPATGLDIASKEEFLLYIQKLIENDHSIIYVTHHIDEIVSGINKVLILKNGKIFATGDKDKILQDKILTQAFDIKIKCKKKRERYFYSV